MIKYLLWPCLFWFFSISGMDKEMRNISHESHISYVERNQRSPKASKARTVLMQSNPTSSNVLDIDTPTPNNSPDRDYVNSITFTASSYDNVGTTNPVAIESSEEETQRQVRKECTKFKLVLLASASALVSSGVTAAVTYFSSGCK